MTQDWRKKCNEGCTCKKHQARPCVPGCACSRHSAEWKKRKCPEGCTCSRHRGTICEPGCTCGRHAVAHNKHTEEEHAEAVERRRARQRDYMREQRKLFPEKFKEERAEHRDRQREYSLKHRHGITSEERSELFAQQEGKCYLCGDQLAGAIHLDHDHSCCPGKRSCGKCLRGIACQHCNQGIGQFGDSPERMRRVADNLELANRRLREQASRGPSPDFAINPGSGVDAEAINPLRRK